MVPNFLFITTSFLVVSLVASFAVSRQDPELDENSINRDYVMRKRYLGINKRFKLNKRYQQCVGPGDAKAHCKHLTFCSTDFSGDARNVLDHLCVIEKTHVGVCCPDNIALSGISGSQIVMDLPAGGYDYESADNTAGCGNPAEARSVAENLVASIQEWPWMAALYRSEYFAQGLEQQLCGGAIISDQHILTAAHCTYGLKPEDLRVRVGEYNYKFQNDSRFGDFAIAEIINHEGFILDTYENDISILRIKRHMEFNTYISPICLPPADESSAEKVAVITGWGQVNYGGSISPVLMPVLVPVWSYEECKYAFLKRITVDNICSASYENPCKVYSGGPLMYQLDNGRWVAIGVVSWGTDCGQKPGPTVYTRVNSYLGWIINNTITK